MAFDVDKIEARIDRVVTGSTEVSTEVGGIRFQNMNEVLEFSKAMSTAGVAVPPHLRGNPGACLAICTQALEWKMSPFAVANKSYIANDRVAYESQLIHAIVEARAPLVRRLRHEIVGEGDERRCKVWGTFRGEDAPHEYTSETLAMLRDARGKNDRGQVKGSPLWVAQPETQLFYSATRTWARMFCPDVILGIYAADELPDEEPRVVSPEAQTLTERLKKSRKRGRGFDHDHVQRETGGTVVEGTATVVDESQLDIEVEAKRKAHEDAIRAAFDAGAAAKSGEICPPDLTEQGRDLAMAWVEGYHSIARDPQ